MLRTIKSILPASFRQRIVRTYEKIARRLPRRQRIAFMFFKSHHYFPNFDNPRRFAEKLIWIKLNSPDISDYVDKVRVKHIVAARIGAQHVIPTLFAGQRLPDRTLRDWPKPYAVKMNNGSGGNLFIHTDADEAALDARLERLLSYDFGRASDELFYSRIEPLVLVEPFVTEDGKSPYDFKFFVFSGRVELVQVDTDRETGHKQAFFDRDFQRITAKLKYDTDHRDIRPPANYAKMVEIAERLGEGHGFVRIDLYSVGGKVLFSEYSFTPGAGLSRFEPQELDQRLGELWVWPDPFLRNLPHLAN